MKRIAFSALAFLLALGPAWAGSSTVQVKDANGTTQTFDVITDASGHFVGLQGICDQSAAANCVGVDSGHEMSVTDSTTHTDLGTINTSLGTINSTLGSPFQAGGALGAGSAIIGKVDIDQGTPGTTNGVVVNSSALPTGAATAANQATANTSLATIATNTGAAVPAGTNLIGYVSGDPCTQKTKSSVSFSTGSSGTQLIAGTSSKNTYICSLSVIASAAAEFSLVVGSGSSVCTSGTPLALIGSTTAANGLAFPANGGITLGNGGASVVNDVAAAAQGYNVCIGISGTANLAGSISYVQQ